MEYRVISVANNKGYSASKEEFEQAVTAHLNNGWQLFGGVCVTIETGYDFARFAQAVVKYDYPDPPITESLLNEHLEIVDDVLFGQNILSRYSVNTTATTPKNKKEL